LASLAHPYKFQRVLHLGSVTPAAFGRATITLGIGPHSSFNSISLSTGFITDTHAHTTVLWPFFPDHLGEPVPEENFWTSWCKGRLTEADTPTIRLVATPSGLTSAHLHHPPIFFTSWMPFLPPNQQRQNTEGKLDSL